MKPILRTLCLLSTSAVLGCSGSGFDDGAGGDSADVGGEAAKSGQFHVIHIPTVDACGTATSESSRILVFDVVAAKDGKSFTLSDGEVTVPCTVNAGGDFRCEPEEDNLAEDGQTTVKASAHYTGTWITGDRFEGARELGISCIGPECADFAPDFLNGLPCASSSVFLGFRTLPENFAPTLGVYETTVEQTFTTCDGDFAALQDQELKVESQDGNTAEVSASDGQGVPHHCTFEGKGHTFCTRNLPQLRGAGEDNLQSTSFADLAWTGPNTFEGGAFQMVSCADGADCSASRLGELPCVSFYRIRAGAPD